jgi:DNA-binding GntR family transcriptional regulator
MTNDPSKAKGNGGTRTTGTLLAEALIRNIIVERYPPGMPLREQEIANRFDVSRPSAREALRLAAHEGFVEIQQWRGARVVNIDFEQFLDLLGMLKDIYARAAALAAVHMPDAVCARLDRMVPTTTAELPHTTQKSTLYRLGFTVGELIGRHCGSPIVRRQFEYLGRLSLWQHRLHLPGTPETEVESLHAYRLLVSAIRLRQSDVAASAARTIILITRRSLPASSRPETGGSELWHAPDVEADVLRKIHGRTQ